VWDQYRDHLYQKQKSQRTVKGYLSDVRRFAAWFEDAVGEPFDPKSITDVDVAQYISFMRTVRKMKPASIARPIRALNSFFDWLVESNVVPTNPTQVSRLPKETKRPPKSLSEQEMYRLRRAVHKGRNARDIAVFEMLAGTGLRVSEVCHLELSDVTISERKGIVRVHGKGGKYREVPLNAEVRKSLRAYLDERDLTPGALFIGQRGPMSPSGVFRLLRKYAAQAGLDVSPHVLRHTFATRLLRGGRTDLVTVKELLGHEDINTTAIYLQPTQEDIQQAVENLTIPGSYNH
jgi:site-specific recombinase XerD